MKVALTVNGQAREVEVTARTMLVELLRAHLGLTGTHVGCDTTSCGACTVLLDGRPVKSCTMLAASADDATVTTIEGLTPDHGLSPVQQAFADEHGLQCGFCTPGFVVSVTALLEADPDPDEETVLTALEGNLCRCTGYVNILRAVRRAAAVLAGDDPPLVAGVAVETPLAITAPPATHVTGGGDDDFEVV